MKTLPVGELKAHFSEVLKDVRGGETVAVEFGRKHTPVAVLVPYDQYLENKPTRKLGVLEGQGQYRIGDDFNMDDQELLDS
jgi:prevent-host-death family protein